MYYRWTGDDHAIVNSAARFDHCVHVFLSRLSMPMHAEHDTDMTNPSVRRSVRLHHTLVLYRNKCKNIVKLFHHLVGA